MSIAQIDLTPPRAVAENAGRGLRLRQQFQRGGTVIGVARARDLRAGQPLSVETILRMAQYFIRHAADRQERGFGDSANPSAGYIAWLLWGGDSGRDWAKAKQAELEGMAARRRA